MGPYLKAAVVSSSLMGARADGRAHATRSGAAATAVAPVAMDDVLSALLAKFPELASLGRANRTVLSTEALNAA
jgi:hypothetical protein